MLVVDDPDTKEFLVIGGSAPVRTVQINVEIVWAMSQAGQYPRNCSMNGFEGKAVLYVKSVTKSF